MLSVKEETSFSVRWFFLFEISLVSSVNLLSLDNTKSECQQGFLYFEGKLLGTIDHIALRNALAFFAIASKSLVACFIFSSLMFIAQLHFFISCRTASSTFVATLDKQEQK